MQSYTPHAIATKLDLSLPTAYLLAVSSRVFWQNFVITHPTVRVNAHTHAHVAMCCVAFTTEL